MSATGGTARTRTACARKTIRSAATRPNRDSISVPLTNSTNRPLEISLGRRQPRRAIPRHHAVHLHVPARQPTASRRAQPTSGTWTGGSVRSLPWRRCTGLTVAQASEVLTVAYFGNAARLARRCVLWSRSPLWGSFTNRRACLRARRFEPNRGLRNEVPELQREWPMSDAEGNGFCHLWGIVSFARERMGSGARGGSQASWPWRTNPSEARLDAS
ncbi:hypothetical protein C8A03DRAFT_37973 [Achaetomium macrosporum]|uniref:Uncharacterized protein n=1 Tax=Achaetomium macrosporum TaxID=79813 RepID=A0AAN7C2N8_9PEZI|nr:hypothetical protein C8A03DRAFT_37973 [Achaetomium macrosporum]